MLSAATRFLSKSPAARSNNKYFLCRLSDMSETSAESSQSFHLKEEQGDLFACPKSDALAHCVSQDLAMGKGIAVQFKRKFGGVTELKKQGKGVGDVAVLQRDDQYIYYLITKLKYNQKPTYKTLHSSLDAMKKHCLQNGVRKICMPKIGCGLDRLEWDKVRKEITDVFKDTPVTITVYSL